MPEYAKMKNADLEALLKSRGLQTGGKKADMVERLTADDDSKTATDAPTTVDASSKPAIQHPEDEIDWDDDEEVPAAAAPVQANATTESATIVENAGGEGAIDNPQAVPNQVADIDPSQTDDLSVNPPAEEEKAASEEPKEPPPDYTRGLAASNLDDEIEKRKARAKKFGLNVEEDEGWSPKGLDEALPERTRKRGREDADEGRGGDKRRGGRFGGRRGRGNGDRRRTDDRDNRDNRDNRDGRDNRRSERSKPNGGSGGWMNDTDKAKAEARKAKFAKPAS
ncbi:hypothetical protein B0J11DRAFT_549781 [Dendryphion nanum]|uniref:SAP domain-containing protein n=1 Tax=Dendryphion nanum TaxID=256645 RepID=A0A9P9DYW5_9PLEO|nr:hypothetical protein B0J11DRAFT_549781 [Dendryphion nanum]